MRLYTFNYGGWFYTFLDGSEACERSFARSLIGVLKLKIKAKYKLKAMAYKHDQRR